MQKKQKLEKEKVKEVREEDLAALQLTEQGLQNLLLQKQVFQFELIETNNALEELKKVKTEGDVFKIVGSLMFKSNKTTLSKELEKKSDILNLRLKAIDKQEEELKSRLIKSRESFLKSLKK